MADINAEMIIAYVRQDTRYQIIEELRSLGVTDFMYSEVDGHETGMPVQGRFEIIVKDDELGDALTKKVLKRGTGYQPPDVRIIRIPINYSVNG